MRVFVYRAGVKSVVESFVRRYGETVRRQKLQEAGETGEERNSSTTDLTLYPTRQDTVRRLRSVERPSSPAALERSGKAVRYNALLDPASAYTAIVQPSALTMLQNS